MIRPGDSGPEVTDWQHKLRDHGFTWLPVTGRHEGLSVTLTRAFQHGASIKVDGIVGPDSRREMERQLAQRHRWRTKPPIDEDLIPEPVPPLPPMPGPPAERKGSWIAVVVFLVIVAAVGFVLWRFVL